MSYRDLREWLEQVENLGELRRVEGADWDLEIGAVADMARKESKTAPCILFDAIKGYPKGYRQKRLLLTPLTPSSFDPFLP
jgi:4-hydroxy-3-polyprenylbenzoate decarboxylase